jgi:multidrug efflux pump subunit AcrA (membrane-fusion protein)
VSAIDILRSKLELKKAELATEQTKEEQIENQLTAKAKKAEVGAAQVALDRRILTAPFDGVVTELIKKPGEWIATGEPVVHIVGIKRLRVMGNLDARQWGPADVAGRDVTVEVLLPRGRTVKVPGTVTYVSPVVTLDHMPVWAEIDVPMENELPLVRAGTRGSMTIHVSRPVATADASPQTAPAATRSAPVRPAATRGVRTE